MKKMAILMLFAMLPIAALLAGCEGTAADDSDAGDSSGMKMIVTVNGTEFRAMLEDNSAAEALAGILESNPIELELSEYGGFEKVGSLGFSLPSSNRQITTRPGDIVLYHGNQIVMFYGSNSWSYTMLGHIDDLHGWEEALGQGSVTAILSLAPSE